MSKNTSKLGKVIHTVDQWDGGGYRVEVLRHPEDCMWDHYMNTESKSTAISAAETVVRRLGFSKARVIDTQKEGA